MRQHRLRIIALLLIALTAFSSLGHAFSWQVTNYNKKKYVPIDNVRTFYKFQNIKQSGRTITLSSRLEVQRNTRMAFTLGGKTCRVNRMKFILCYPIIQVKGKPHISVLDIHKIVHPILKPSFSSRRPLTTVILDPGHGGKDSGATSNLGKEAHYALNVARTVKRLLEAKGFRVVMTRNDDRYLTLSQRVAIANRYQNAVFVSIHFNSSNNRSAHGLETFTLSPKGIPHYGRGLRNSDFQIRTGNHQDAANIILATAVHGRCLELLKPYNTIDRGIKRARYNVLTNISHPALLIEGGFLTHPAEGRRVHTARYRNILANCIASGIVRYRIATRGR